MPPETLPPARKPLPPARTRVFYQPQRALPSGRYVNVGATTSNFLDAAEQVESLRAKDSTQTYFVMRIEESLSVVYV